MALLCWDLLPPSMLASDWFSVLARFVAVNTILYVALSVFKITPKLYLSDFVRRDGRRAETRSIHPGDPIEPFPRSAHRCVAETGPGDGRQPRRPFRRRRR